MSPSHPLASASLLHGALRPPLPPAWPAAATVPPAPALPVLRTILVVTDFSVQGDHALECAAQLAADHDATLRILHAHHRSEMPCPQPLLRMQDAVSHWSQRLARPVVAVDAVATSLRQIAAHAASADLLVLAHHARASLGSVLLGPASLRLARRSHCPVLVVQRRARAQFARILVAVDLAGPSRTLIKWACALAPQTPVELFHAVSQLGESRLRQFDLSAQGMRAYQRRAMEQARCRLRGLAASLGHHATRLAHSTGYGEPAQQMLVHQSRVGADLLVVGLQRQGALATLLLGNTARPALEGTSGNLLLVPYGARAGVPGA